MLRSSNFPTALRSLAQHCPARRRLPASLWVRSCFSEATLLLPLKLLALLRSATNGNSTVRTFQARPAPVSRERIPKPLTPATTLSWRVIRSALSPVSSPRCPSLQICRLLLPLRRCNDGQRGDD